MCRPLRRSSRRFTAPSRTQAKLPKLIEPIIGVFSRFAYPFLRCA